MTASADGRQARQQLARIRETEPAELVGPIRAAYDALVTR